MQIFASLTSYNVTTMSSGHRFPAQPFEEYRHFIERHESYWDNMDTGALPYGPVVTVGWDVTPRWEHRVPWPPEKNHYPYTPIVVNNTPERFGELVRRGLRQIATSRVKPPALLVNSWNEWTEGSALLPQEKYGSGYLEALKNALETGPLPPAPGRNEGTVENGPQARLAPVKREATSSIRSDDDVAPPAT